MQRYGRQGGERRVCGRHRFGHDRAQQAGYGLELGVAGLPGTARRHELAGPDPVDGGADLDYQPGRGVAERHVGSEPAAYRPGRRGDTLGLRLAHDLADQVRPGACLGQQAGPGQRGDRPFGAGRDHRGYGAHEHLGRADRRAGDVEYLDRPAAGRLHDLLHDVPSPAAWSRARFQTVTARTGKIASIRQVSTGASAVLPNPVAAGLVSAAKSTGVVAAVVTEKVPAGLVTRAVRPSTRTAEPGEQVPADGDLVPPPPGDRVLDPQPVAGQPPATAVPGAAGQVPEPVVDRLAADAGRVGAGGQPADPGPPPGPERAPHLGGVRPVQLDRAVRGGGPLVPAHRTRFVAGRAGIDQQRHPVHVQQAAERVGVRVGRQGRRARRPDVGEQVPAADRGPHQAGRGQHVQRAAGRRAGPQHGERAPGRPGSRR